MSATPLACPFCDKQPNFAAVVDVEDGYDHGYSIICGECGVEMSDEYKDEVVKRWNTRSGIAPVTEDSE
jgi:transcription elongation factor Elf1